MSESRIDLLEFQRDGFLQEANRLFFHPLGMALTLVIDDESSAPPYLTVYRADEANGYAFSWEDAGGEPARKAANVAAELRRVAPARVENLGYRVQPLPGEVG